MASAASAWSAFAQIRDAIFAKVGQRAVRELAIRTFRHLHALSLKFHLERRTGGLSRIISRGTLGIDTVLRFSLFNTFPTALEILLVCGVLAWSFGWLYALVVLVTIALYIGFTYAATEWRINLRRTMNACRHRRQHQGDRQPSEFRDGEVFRQ